MFTVCGFGSLRAVSLGLCPPLVEQTLGPSLRCRHKPVASRTPHIRPPVSSTLQAGFRRSSPIPTYGRGSSVQIHPLLQGSSQKLPGSCKAIRSTHTAPR